MVYRSVSTPSMENAKGMKKWKWSFCKKAEKRGRILRS
jgi:hypothetical protein